ncbi:hypothetical protein E2I00_016709 [Balaenoptera physalus]|uniref:PX domain-containing protein n=1 Tax=Balaenoptera physalus TaxID=9770 RepID=A0A643C717_BALPH|nr:hypothetical protein E2I00_016709 [Balaenoptera physalus]
MPLQEFVSVWVRDPRIQKEDFWHSYIDYEICIHVSMPSVVDRNHIQTFLESIEMGSDFICDCIEQGVIDIRKAFFPQVRLIFFVFFKQTNSMCFTMKTSCVRRRYREFVWLRQRLQSNALLVVLQNALLLSDSSLHLFLQSHLNSEDIEACVSGQTKYSVEEAIHKFALMNRRFPEEEEEGKKENDIDYDSESSSSGFGHSSDDSSSHGCKMSTALQES